MSGFIKMKLAGQAELQREIDKLAKRAGIMGAEFADFSAGVAQKAVIRNVQPFGMGKKAREQGERAVALGIRNTFKPVGKRRKGVIDSITEASRIHHGMRDSRGRVAHARPFPPLIYFPTMMAYIRLEQEKVGKAKGSFSDEARRLGVKPQKWITRHGKGGSSVRKGRNFRVYWVFSSAVPYTSSGHVMGRRGVTRVLKMQNRNLQRALAGKLRRMGKKYD